MSRPPLASLEIATVVARHTSFSNAALELGLTHGAVSRKISALESWLGILLFERHGRGVRLTPDGQRFIAQISDAFRLIDVASDRWKRSNPAIIRISVVPSFAKLWLMARIKKLEAESGCQIDLAIEDRNADLEGGEVDIAIRYGRGRWPNVQSIQFGAERHFPVANEEILKSLNGGSAGEQLASLPLLHNSDATGWRNWFKEIVGISIKPKQSDRRFEDYTLTLAAAEQGLGIALARSPLADRYLSDYNLLRIDKRTTYSPLNYYVLTRLNESRPRIVGTVAALQTHFKSTSFDVDNDAGGISP